MNKILENINKLNYELINENDTILNKIKKIPIKPNYINIDKFNEFYNFENNTKILDNNTNILDNSQQLIFPNIPLHISSNSDVLVNNIMTNFNIIDKYNTQRQQNYKNFLKTKPKEVNIVKKDTNKNNVLSEINDYLTLDFKINKNNFDDEYCFNDINDFSIKYNNDFSTKYNKDNIKIYSDELNSIFPKSLEVIENYNIENLIINPNFNKFINPSNKQQIIPQNMSLFVPYNFDKQIFVLINKFIENNYTILVEKCNNLKKTPYNTETLLNRLEIKSPKILQEELQELVNIINNNVNLNFLALEDNYYEFIKQIEKRIELLYVNKNSINDYIKNYNQIIDNIENVNNTINKYNSTIKELQIKYDDLYNQYINHSEKLRVDLKNFYDGELNKKYYNKTAGIIENYKLLIKFLIVYNERMDYKTLNSKSKQNYLIYKVKIPTQQKGGFDKIFDSIVNISLTHNNNLEQKIRFNNLLFYSHILFIINYAKANIERYIIHKINLNELKAYLNITNKLLQIIKTDNDQILRPYFLRYHYFNLKIVNKFLNKLKNNWTTDISSNNCNKEIIKILKNNDNIYFNLLNLKYTSSMKRSIFIFIALKPILDNVYNYIKK
jgi:hypothetical protein